MFTPSPKQFDKLSVFLSLQNKIRVVIDDAGNFGNQAASYNLILKIRQLGFKGEFEVIYFDNVKDKLIQLFNLPKTDSKEFNSKEYKIKFIGLNSFLKKRSSGQVDSLALGISGAVDKKPNDWKAKISDDNFANVLNVDSFVLFSPYYNLDGICNTKIYLRDKTQSIEQENSCSKMLITPIADFSDANDFLFHSQQGKYFLNENPALKSLVNLINDKSINFQSLYGWTLRESPSNLLNMILGASYAQMNGDNDLKKPLIIGAFFDLKNNNDFLAEHNVSITNEEVLRSLIYLDKWGNYDSYPGANQLKKAIKDHDLRSRLKIATHLGAETKSVIKHLQPNEILLLTLPSMPKKVFDGLYTHHASNIFPPVREGASSLTSLISVTGKPHIHCRSLVDWEINLSNADDELKNRLIKLNDVICMEMYGSSLNFESWITNDLSDMIGNYIIDSMNPSSEVTQFFVHLKQEALQIDNDRIANDLNTALEFLNTIQPKENSAPAMQCRIRNSSSLIRMRLKDQQPKTVFDKMINVATEYARSVVEECPSYFNKYYITCNVMHPGLFSRNPTIGMCQDALSIAGPAPLNIK